MWMQLLNWVLVVGGLCLMVFALVQHSHQIKAIQVNPGELSSSTFAFRAVLVLVLLAVGLFWALIGSVRLVFY